MASPLPILTFLSDFGTRDYYVAAVKGVLLSLAPGTTLVDVGHQVPPGDVAAGSFLLAAALPAFPAGAVHLAVVDPGVGSQRAPAGPRGRAAGPRRPLAAGRAGQRALRALLRRRPPPGGDRAARPLPRRAGRHLRWPRPFRAGRRRPPARRRPRRAGAGNRRSGARRRQRRRDPFEGGRPAGPRGPSSSTSTASATWSATCRPPAFPTRRRPARWGSKSPAASSWPGSDCYAEIPAGEAAWLVGSLGTVELSLGGASLAEAWSIGRGENLRISWSSE